jgi:hypothetical protein
MTTNPNIQLDESGSVLVEDIEFLELEVPGYYKDGDTIQMFMHPCR